MIDHLMKFDDELHARAAVGPLGYGAIDADSGHWHWSPVVLPGQTNTLTEAVVDEEGNQVTPAVRLPGYWLTISTAEPQPALIEMANHACRKATVRGGSIVYLAATEDAEQIALASLSPIWS